MHSATAGFPDMSEFVGQGSKGGGGVGQPSYLLCPCLNVVLDPLPENFAVGAYSDEMGERRCGKYPQSIHTIQLK